MTSRVQTIRSSVKKQRPTGRQTGELYVNFADLQVGVVNPSGAAQDLVAIRFFSPATDYVVGDFVVQASKVYQAKVAVAAAPFNPAQWDTFLTSPDLVTALATKVNVTDYEDLDVLAKVKNVDGAGSLLDADLLDGQHGAYYAKDSDMTAAETRMTAIEEWNDDQDASIALKANISSPDFTNVPTAPTAANGTNTRQLATTAFVAGAYANKQDLLTSVASFELGQGLAGNRAAYIDLHAQDAVDRSARIIRNPGANGSLDIAQLGTGPINLSASGGVTAPTPTAGDNDTSVATTAFVQAAIADIPGASPSNAVPLVDGTAAAGTSALYARGDHRHPTDTSRAALNAPVFTGDARAVTPPIGDNDTSIATSAFVRDQMGAVMPEQYGGAGNGSADDTAAILSAANVAIADKKVLWLSPGKTYKFTQLNLPAGLVIKAEGAKLRYAGALTSGAMITLNADTRFDSLYLSSPGGTQAVQPVTNAVIIKDRVVGERLEVVSDSQWYFNESVLITGSDVRIGYVRTYRQDNALSFFSTSTTAQIDGIWIGFFECESYRRAFAGTYASFRVDGMRARVRSPNGGKLPGNNGVLITGCANWSMGDCWIEDAGEHAFRCGGSSNINFVTKDWSVGTVTAIRTGGCAFKVNPSLLTSAGVTEKCYRGHVDAVIGIDIGDPANQGNEEFLRITHARGLTIDRAYCFIEGDAVSGQTGLIINDSFNVYIGELGGDNFNAGFISFDKDSDVDGTATFGGSCYDIHIGRLTGSCAGHSAIGITLTGFNYGRISIVCDGARGWNYPGGTPYLVAFYGGTCTDVFTLGGRVYGSVAPAYLNAPAKFIPTVAWTAP
jgi:hypothetical protein